MESFRNTLIVLLLAGLVSGVGGYVTFKQQPEELESIEEQRELARLQQAEVEELLVEKAASEEAADEVLRKWNARYKFIPDEMNTADIVEYLEGLTRSGFESFNIRLSDENNSSDISYYTFEVNGTGYYSNVYDVVWHLENNRDFYRIRDLSVAHAEVFEENPNTGEDRRRDMVRFSMEIDAYFGGHEGLSKDRSELVPVSRELLPAHDPIDDSFYPIVRDDLPPNDERLLEVENATLVSIADNKAVFDDQHGRHVVSEGDEVYLGRIVLIDPGEGVVRARLNKGGVIDNVELRMFSEEDSWRQ